MKNKPKILVANTSDDTVSSLTEILEGEGYTVDAVSVRHMRLGEVSIEHAMRHDPDLVIFDLAPPYDDNVAYYQKTFRPHSLVRGKPIVLTTTNEIAVK